MIWCIWAGVLYIIVQAAICLFFKGAEILNKKTVVFDNASPMEKSVFTVILSDGPVPSFGIEPLHNVSY
jgi:hypothetical protein